MTFRSEQTWWLVCDDCGARVQVDENWAYVEPLPGGWYDVHDEFGAGGGHMCIKCRVASLTATVAAMFESASKSSQSNVTLPALLIAPAKDSA